MSHEQWTGEETNKHTPTQVRYVLLWTYSYIHVHQSIHSCTAIESQSCAVVQCELTQKCQEWFLFECVVGSLQEMRGWVCSVWAISIYCAAENVFLCFHACVCIYMYECKKWLTQQTQSATAVSVRYSLPVPWMYFRNYTTIHIYIIYCIYSTPNLYCIHVSQMLKGIAWNFWSVVVFGTYPQSMYYSR